MSVGYVQLEPAGRADRRHVGGRHCSRGSSIRHHSNQPDHHPRHARPPDCARYDTQGDSDVISSYHGGGVV